MARLELYVAEMLDASVAPVAVVAQTPVRAVRAQRNVPRLGGVDHDDAVCRNRASIDAQTRLLLLALSQGGPAVVHIDLELVLALLHEIRHVVDCGEEDAVLHVAAVRAETVARRLAVHVEPVRPKRRERDDYAFRVFQRHLLPRNPILPLIMFPRRLEERLFPLLDTTHKSSNCPPR